MALSLSAAQGEVRDLAARLAAAKKTEEELRTTAREAQKSGVSESGIRR